MSMRVDLYSINGDGTRSVEAFDVTVASCFPDDPADAADMERRLCEGPTARYGGGAAPLFEFVRVPLEPKWSLR